MNNDFTNTGKEVEKIPVKISYRIIELFSEGLYSSPNKAIEELVSNSFDAGAKNVHIVISPDRSEQNALIAVIDDGVGMDNEDLKRHWLIGVSNKRLLADYPLGRKQIGKFGIGKLATFVLANKLTHISKIDDKYFAVTMDYSRIPEGRSGSVELEGDEGVNLALRTLEEEEVKKALPDLLLGSRPGHKAIRLFGNRASKSWTIAILSDLKDMAREIKLGRLSWVLRTAMPLRPDFKLFLNGEPQLPTKLDQEPLNRWIIGQDLTVLGEPAPDDLEVTENPSADPIHKIGLSHPKLGRITGYIEVYENRLTEGFDRSHGFFVYVHNRLLNIDDPHFGISANKLRHGTFSRFRMVVYIDRLDEELRSTRESVREAALSTLARNFLHACFNVARNWLQEYDLQQSTEFRAASRIRQTSTSLTRWPIIGLLKLALEGKASPRFLEFPRNLTQTEASALISNLENKALSEEGLEVNIETVELSQGDPIAKYDVQRSSLRINSLHPFVANFQEDFDSKDSLTLICMAEILTEAYLFNSGYSDGQVIEIMERRDLLLRQFARFKRRRSANQIASDLMDAITDENQLEIEVIAAFDSLGYEAIRIGRSNNPDGIATAYLSAKDGIDRRYSISIEAKSKEQPGRKVTAKSVGISTIARHRNEHNCDHAVVVGPDFPTEQGEKSALIKEARENIQATKKTISLMRVYDLARLVRIRALKHFDLEKLRELFQRCVTPEEVSVWVDSLAKEEGPVQKYPQLHKSILETIWELQKEEPGQPVEYSALQTVLRREKNIRLKKDLLITICRTLALLASNIDYFDDAVYLNQRPDKVVETALDTLREFPEEEQRLSTIKL